MVPRSSLVPPYRTEKASERCVPCAFQYLLSRQCVSMWHLECPGTTGPNVATPHLFVCDRHHDSDGSGSGIDLFRRHQSRRGRPQRVRRAGLATSRFPEPRHRHGPQYHEFPRVGDDPRFRRHGPGPARYTLAQWLGAELSAPAPCLPEMPAAIAAQPSPEKAAKLAGNWRVAVAPAPVSDRAAEEAGRAARQAARADEADGFFARAKQAEADGKPHVAKIYYQMAVRRASGELNNRPRPAWMRSAAVRLPWQTIRLDPSRANDTAFPLDLPRVSTVTFWGCEVWKGAGR